MIPKAFVQTMRCTIAALIRWNVQFIKNGGPCALHLDAGRVIRAIAIAMCVVGKQERPSWSQRTMRFIQHLTPVVYQVEHVNHHYSVEG